jgi:putative toxin-antitoxin system antitoxin component (TIGR02293 family)
MLPLERVLAVLGVSSRTLARRRRERRFSTDESDRVLRVARLFAKVLELYEGDRDGAATWVTTGQLVVGRCTPLDLARTELGAREVERLVGRLQQGVFS